MADLGFDGTITLEVGVSDLRAAVAWYTKKLGFEKGFAAPAAGWAEVTSPVKKVTIGLNTNGARGGGGFTPVLGVKDITRAVTTLKRRKVQLDGDIVEIPGMVKLATFRDLDGNRLMLAESLA
jgi:predicted enzyme related to lactoylglutathione lyase